MALISSVAAFGARSIVKGAKRALGKKKKKIRNTNPDIDEAYVMAQRFAQTGPPIPAGYSPPRTAERVEVDVETGEVFEKRRRRRRKQLLTSSDRQDIAFIVGTLGKGQMGQAAISQLLARACN